MTWSKKISHGFWLGHRKFPWSMNYMNTIFTSGNNLSVLSISVNFDWPSTKKMIKIVEKISTLSHLRLINIISYYKSVWQSGSFQGPMMQPHLRGRACTIYTSMISVCHCGIPLGNPFIELHHLFIYQNNLMHNLVSVKIQLAPVLLGTATNWPEAEVFHSMPLFLRI